MADSKIHYIIHLATWMKWHTLFCVMLSFYLMYDNTEHILNRLRCMQYEAKHNYFKHLARVFGNFKNIARTLAEHHHQYMCYQMSEPANY